MIKISGLVVLAGLVLSGCAQKQQEKSLVTPPVVNQPVQQETAPAPAASNENAQVFSASSPQAETVVSSDQPRIQQCRKELDAMRVYSKASYDKYQAEFMSVANKTNKYLQIKDSIGADLNDVAMPGYQFQIRELCFRVKTRLSQLVFRQVQG